MIVPMRSAARTSSKHNPVNVIDIVATASFYLDFVMTQLQQDHDVLEFFRYRPASFSAGMYKMLSYRRETTLQGAL